MCRVLGSRKMEPAVIPVDKCCFEYSCTFVLTFFISFSRAFNASKFFQSDSMNENLEFISGNIYHCRKMSGFYLSLNSSLASSDRRAASHFSWFIHDGIVLKLNYSGNSDVGRGSGSPFIDEMRWCNQQCRLVGRLIIQARLGMSHERLVRVNMLRI